MSDEEIQTFAIGGEKLDYSLPEEETKLDLPTPEQFLDTQNDDPMPRRKQKEEDVSYDTPDDQKEHQTLLIQLSRFGNSPRFASFQLTIAKLRKLNIEELSELLERVKCTCLSRSNEAYFTNGFLGAIQVAETAVANSPWKDKILLQGMREMCSKNELLLDALSIYEISNNMSAGSPLALIAWSLFSCAAKTHSINLFLQSRAKMQAVVDGESKGEEETKEEAAPQADPLLEFEK